MYTLMCGFLWSSSNPGYSYNGLYGEALPERGTFFRLHVYERVGILLVEVYKGGGSLLLRQAHVMAVKLNSGEYFLV